MAVMGTNGGGFSCLLTAWKKWKQSRAGSKSATTAAAATAAVHYYSVAPGYRLNVRRGPGTQYGIVRVLPEGAQVAIFCQTPGTSVVGPYGTSNIWDNIANGEFVSD